MTRNEAEILAIEALQFIAGDDTELERFIALTGIAPSELRQAAASPAFLSGVIDYFLSDEPTLLAFAAASGRPPQDIPAARQALSAPLRRR